MAIVYTFSTTATRRGAVDLNRLHRTAAQEDLGGKVQALVSQVNLLMSLVSDAAASGVTFSGLSGGTVTPISNFRS
jgi:hypothetical protein